MTRYLTRDRAAIAAALIAPIAAAAILLPFRSTWSNTNVALLLVVVVVAVAAIGNRIAGAIAAIGAAVWFDFFFTLPYYRFTIRHSSDVTTFVLLLVVGVAVSQLAAHARRMRVLAITDAGYLAQIHETAALAQSAKSPDAVVDLVREQLVGLLALRTAGLSTGCCWVIRPGWSVTARCGPGMAGGTWRNRACPPKRWSCGCSATASTTAGSC
jgi:K+-sensing histidine kinase KdpD